MHEVFTLLLVVTASHIICPNVELTSSGRALLGWPSAAARTPIPRIGKPLLPEPLKGVVITETSTANWKVPCGLYCPQRKRQVHGFVGIGEFAWGGAHGSLHPNAEEWRENPYREEWLKWRVGKMCNNQHCPRRILPAEF
ncbi:hypothetical protein R3P38DRAFT_3168869 [Favolaschia claudopus]|uniref:Secreted protein n=1 Tax=Favolaschia claudopus TaxID=2862362 RepID=A0AAW0DZ84_9AGAR